MRPAGSKTIVALVAAAATMLSVPFQEQDSAAAAVALTCAGKTATLVGTKGDDVLTGTKGPDVIVGGPGRDIITGRGGDDVICEGSTPRESTDEDPTSLVDGGVGADVLLGGRGPDYVLGGPGRDVIKGGRWRDYLLGENGKDILGGSRGPDTLSGDYGIDRLLGGGGRDEFRDFAGDNTIFGGPGNDVFHSGGGNDHFTGGSGRNTVSYLAILRDDTSAESHCRDVRVNLAKQQGHARDFGLDTLIQTEEVWTSGGDDTLMGDERDNTFYTGFVACGKPSSLNRVHGRGGNDTLSFATLIEGTVGGEGIFVDLAEGRATWTFNGTNDYRFTSIESLTGTANADRLFGDSKANVLDGGSVTSDDGDLLVGRGGDDRLDGGKGDDRLNGGSGVDQLSGGGGQDHLDGGSGTNTNDGGRGDDLCLRPDEGPGAIECEAP